MPRAARIPLYVEDPREVRSGGQLVRMLRREAARRGVRVTLLVKPLTKSPAAWLNSLEAAKVVKPETIERVAALLAGEPVPVSAGQLVARAPQARSVQSLSREPAMPPQRPLPRVTCFNCGGTSMAPCVHLRRSGWVE